MAISLVIPTLQVDEGKKEILERCINSLSPMVDEVIVISDKEASLANKINQGLKQAKNEYIVVSNDDVYMRSGTLLDLCHSGEVHVPVVHGGIDKTFHGHMWCIPKSAYDTIGGYDESCPGPYYIDSDYWVRLIKAGIPVVKNESVHIDHPEPGRTLKHLQNNDHGCREWFIEKHGRSYLALVE